MWFTRKPVPSPAPTTGYLGVEALLKSADRLRDAGDALAAADTYAKALAMAPDRNDVKVQLGNMLKDTGRLRDAETLYRDAQKTDPDDDDVCIQLGHVLKLMGHRDEALVQYRRAAALNPNSWAAAEELAEVGSSWQQERRFDVHFRAGGVEALMGVSRQLAAMRAAIDAMAASLPDPLALAAFPLDLYGAFRDGFDCPPSPASDLPLTVVLLADREPLAVLRAQVAAFRDGSHGRRILLAVGRDPERRRLVETIVPPGDASVRWLDADPTDEPAVAEWRAARGVETGWIVLLAEGAMLSPRALGWFAVAAERAAPGGARAFVTDEDVTTLVHGRPLRSAPAFRQVVDHDTLLQCNPFGETIAVEVSAFAAAAAEPPSGSVTRARSGLLLELSARGPVGHVPFPLVTIGQARPTSLPEHRLAIADHLARRSLADRVNVAKGETEATYWRPASNASPIGVVIAATGDADHLRDFIRSLREAADVPDALAFAILDAASAKPETRALMAELSAKRYAQVIEAGVSPNLPRLVNEAAAALDCTHLVTAHDDLTMTTERWDSRLRGLLERDDVGAVGVRLLYGDDTIQHAGFLFGWKGSITHDGQYEPADAPGPAARWHVTRAASAVSGAFLATRRDRFLQHGGFDPAFPMAYGDVDYALRLRQAGLKALWTPTVTLRHHEPKGVSMVGGARAGGDEAAFAALRARWGATLDGDPSLHPIWYPATLPFRLIASPSVPRMLAHIGRTASPWGVEAAWPDKT